MQMIVATRSPKRRPAKPGVVRDLRRKNLILDQGLLNRAQEALGAATETETVMRALRAALDLASFRREVDSGFRELGGKGGFVNYFDEPEALVVPPAAKAAKAASRSARNRVRP